MIYRISHQGHKVPLAPQRADLAKAMDANHDHYVSNREIADFYGIGPDRPGCDRAGRINENKWSLRALPNPDAAAYHSSQEVADELAALSEKYPTVAERVSLGKTEQGRDIWALHVTENPENPGIVITGCHHAREWMSVEIPLHSAKELLEGYAAGDPACRERISKGDFWFVPVVNPDGLEYSRNTDNMWRKNGHGVDVNRNYFDPAHPGLYRPDWDKPGTTEDDSERGADDPNSQVFRGLSGASEKETQAMQQLKFGHPNIRGVLDYHSFGEEVLYPHSYTKTPPPDVEKYRTLGEVMNQAAGGALEVKSSADLYPISGGPLDLEYNHGILGFEVEVNGCFQPRPEEIGPTCERYHEANMAFAAAF